ncbi:hypothetical protein LMG22037_05502 [Paraburkholderia phenoliruptrix]|uniref:Uncharacterized protein n=2 Tax=Paraburkholderia phenoliruptrix TaxID=252970 RepID=A0A6J5C9J7_9BURK|nr:hypothetical protein LMG22037_05502 [Paraburkholderia phenoliruptrix]
MQSEMTVQSAVQEVKAAPSELVKMCDDELDAVRLCIQLSKFTQDFIGKRLSIDKGYMTRLLQGNAGALMQKRIALMRLCGTYAPVQFECAELGLVPVPADEYERLVAAAAQLESVKMNGTRKAS